MTRFQSMESLAAAIEHQLKHVINGRSEFASYLSDNDPRKSD